MESTGMTPITSECLFFSALRYPTPCSTVSSICNTPPSDKAAMCRSGLINSTPLGIVKSAAVARPGPFTDRVSTCGSGSSMRTTKPLMLSTISTTSSSTPGTVVNSWGAFSMRTLETAAPGIRDSKVRRIVLPKVCPNPGSNGSTTNCARVGVTDRN